MIIKLKKYNEIGELLIENRTSGLQGHVSYQDGGWRVSVTTAAVHMGKKETGMQIGYRGTYNRSLSWEWEKVCTQLLQSNQRGISMQ